MGLKRSEGSNALDGDEGESTAQSLLRHQIVMAAQVLMAEGGYENVTMRKVAERISRSPMSLYHHFAAKEDILVALARDIFGRIGSTLPRTGGDALETLYQAMLKYMEFGVNHPTEYTLLFLTRRTRPSEKQTEKHVESILNRAGGQDAFRRMLEYVDTGLAAGVLRGERFTVSTVLWAGMHGCVSLLLTQEKAFLGPAKHFAEATATTLLRGVCAPDALRASFSALEGEMAW